MDIESGINFSELTFSFDERILIDHFTEEIKVGERVCLMGPSGVGKSTLLHSVIGLTHPQRGTISVNGVQVEAAQMATVRAMVGWLPQQLIFPYRTVLELLQAPYRFAVNSNRAFQQSRCLDYFNRLGLPPELLQQELELLSGGEKQRVALVSLLLLGRKILLLDEPTSALDPQSRNKLTELLASLTDTTILAITHDHQFAQAMSRIVTLQKR